MTETNALERIRLLTPDEVCDLLRCTKDWLYDVTQKGTFPHVKLGRQLRFRAVEIDAYLRKSECKAGAPEEEEPPLAATLKGARRLRARKAVAAD